MILFYSGCMVRNHEDGSEFTLLSVLGNEVDLMLSYGVQCDMKRWLKRLHKKRRKQGKKQHADHHQPRRTAPPA